MEVTPNLGGCINLRVLVIFFCFRMRSLPDLSNLCKLQSVYFREISDVRSLSGLSSLTNLKALTLYWIEDLTEIVGLNSLINLEVFTLEWCEELCKLEGLCGLVSLKRLDCVRVGLFEVNDLKKLVHLQDLTVSCCRNITSLVGLECLTSLRRLGASFCSKLKELPECSNLKKLERVDLSGSGICNLPSNFGHLSKRRVFKLDRCGRLFEPLVVWLLEQRREMLKTSDGWVSRDYPFAEPTEDRLWGSIKEIAAYYLDESSLSSEFSWCLNGMFVEGGILPSARSLEEMEGGIESLIRILCDEPELGILSLLVAKYAGSGKYWALVTAKFSIEAMCGRIVQFLDQQLEAVKDLDDRNCGGAWLRIEFIVERLTRNEIMAVALGGHDICRILRRWLIHPRIRILERLWNISNVRRGVEDALERCSAGEPIKG